LNGTAAQVVSTPLGNTFAVLGAAFVWAAGRCLRTTAPRPRRLAALPLLVLVVTVFDDPADDIWAGGTAYLVCMGLLIGASAVEMALLLRDQREVLEARSQYRFAIVSLALASSGMAVYYLLRAVFFATLGPESQVFIGVFGSATTTILTMLLLVVVTFSMSSLSHEQQTSELRVQATRDGLTGALNRTEFLRVAQRRIDRGVAAHGAAVVVADLDHFKRLNDGFGHAAGDRALFAFADACRAVIGQDGVVGRLGGDEFVLLTEAPAEAVVAEIARRYERRGSDATPLPSASFGIAAVVPDHDVSALVTLADVALYQAKAAGRGCAVRYDGHAPAVADARRTT
jgi:diguanylate cyclase (GGDEF)-like protein